MELKRKMYDKLAEWKAKKNHKPVIIEGLRQVGKSYIAEYFASKNYENVIVFDFRHDKALINIFKNSKDNERLSVDSIIQNAKVYFPNKNFIKHKTCLVFDEIGDAPLARESFKLFSSDSGFDIIATGSLLGVSGINEYASKDTPVGYEEYLNMTSLDFEEFLWANKVSQESIDLVKESIKDIKEINPTINDVFSSYLLRYIIVGGMPEALITFLDTNNVLDARNVQLRLLKDYEDDFGKKVDKEGRTIIDSKLLVRTLRTYHSIPDQLAKENKKFKYSMVEGGGRSSEFSDSIEWLTKAGIILKAYNLRSIESPLIGNKNIDEFKVYFADIGLLLACYPLATTKDILNGNLGAYKGAIYESLIAEMLYKEGFPLFYYSNTKKHLENDFFIETKNGIDVIEVKSTNGKMASAKALANGLTPYKINKVYKVMNGNISLGDFYISIPHYSFPFYLEEIVEELKEGLTLKELPKI